METQKPALLAVGYWQPATGFARVLEAILTPFAAQYAVHLIGIGYKGPMRAGAITVHPCNLAGGDVFGVRQAAAFVERERPALVFLLNDLWILGKYPPALAPFRAHTALVCYCPLDGMIVDAAMLAPLAGVDHLVVYTAFAHRGVEQGAAQLRDAGTIAAFPPISVIPHGVDTDVFHPLPVADRAAAKRRLFPHIPDAANAFVVLNANRPQPRKRIDLTLAAFAHFAAGKPAHVRLVLHHAITHAGERESLAAQAADLGIAERVTFSPPDDRPATDAALNLLYNACDVGVNTAMGEGWGLVSFEHAATGAAQIVPRHSACAELWAGAAEMLDVGEPSVPRFSPFAMAAVAPETVAAALAQLYADPVYRNTMARAAYDNATRRAYRWEQIAGQWRAVCDAATARLATGGET